VTSRRRRDRRVRVCLGSMLGVAGEAGPGALHEVGLSRNACRDAPIWQLPPLIRDQVSGTRAVEIMARLRRPQRYRHARRRNLGRIAHLTVAA
jgi:hypothetical protein